MIQHIIRAHGRNEFAWPGMCRVFVPIYYYYYYIFFIFLFFFPSDCDKSPSRSFVCFHACTRRKHCSRSTTRLYYYVPRADEGIFHTITLYIIVYSRMISCIPMLNKRIFKTQKKKNHIFVTRSTKDSYNLTGMLKKNKQFINVCPLFDHNNETRCKHIRL